MIPCTNCIIAVPQDKVYTVENFGSFIGIKEPGLSFAGPDLCGLCVSLKSLSTRVEQHIVEIATKTKDNVFVKAVVAVQMGVRLENAQDAVYKLDNVREQLESYVSNVVRAMIPALDLDEAFVKKEVMSGKIQEVLGPQMSEFGFTVHHALVVDLKVNADVVRAMNEVNRQNRLREASIMASEAEKIRTVRAAEAAADAKDLQGQGIAKQRAAIIEGLRASISGGDESQLSTEDISALLLTTQYFETLRDIGTRPTCKTYYLPNEDSDDLDAQIRSGLLQGQVCLEYMNSMSGAGGGSRRPQPEPQQQDMDSPPRSSTPPRRRRHDHGNETAEQQAQQAQQAQQRQAQQRIQQMQQNLQMIQQAQQAPQAPQPVTMQIQIPPGAPPGSVIQVQAPDGRVLSVQVPAGAGAGSVIQISA